MDRHFTLKIYLDNDAMRSGDHIADALISVAGRVRADMLRGAIHDANGNHVGDFKIVHLGSVA